MVATTTVTGGPETQHAFDQLKQDIADMTATHGKVARARLGAIAALTPVRSGDLQSSWDAVGSAKAGSITSPLAYAGVIEYGWPARNISPAAMISRTLAAEQGAIAQEYEADILAAAKRRGFRIA